MSHDPWDWGVEDVIHALCHPQGQLRSQYPNLKFNPEELETTLRSNGIDGETLLVALTRDNLKQDLEISSLGLRFKIWKVIEVARSESAGFQAFRGENPDKFADSFNVASASEPPKHQSTHQPIARHQIAKDSEPALAPSLRVNVEDGINQTLPSQASVSIKTRHGEHVVVEESGRKRRKLTLAPKVGVYLDDHSMPLDSVFYGTTTLGNEVDLEVYGRSEEMQRESLFNWTQTGADSALTHFEHCIAPKPGLSKYVNRLMQRYLLGSSALNPRYFKRGDTFAVGFQSFPSSKGKSGLISSSMSVILNERDGPVMYRVSANEWEHDETYTKEKHKATFTTRRKNVQTANNLEDWSFLDKYFVESETDDIIPLYGESGSEGSYDTETWNEIEAEALDKEKEKQPSGLTLDKMKMIIEAEKAAVQAEWELKKLPFLQDRAWKIWSRSRLQGTLNADLRSLQKEMARLNNRLKKFEENICEMSWAKASEVKFQCQSLQPTVVDMLAAQWRMDLLPQPNAPPRSQGTTGHKPRPRIRPGDLADDEEELTESEFDEDFVVDDERATGNVVKTYQDAGIAAKDIEMASLLRNDHQPSESFHVEDQQSESSNALKIHGDSSELPYSSLELTDRMKAVEPPKPSPFFRMPREIQSRLPHEPSEIISLSSSEDDTETDGSGAKSKGEVDILRMNLTQLRRINLDDIQRTASSQAKLAWAMSRQSNANNGILKLLEMDTEKLLHLVSEGYKSLLSHSYKTIRGMPPNLDVDPQCIFHLCLWFISWSKNVIWTAGPDMSPKGISRPLLAGVIEEWPPNPENWQQFVVFVKERIQWVENKSHERSNTVKERGRSTRAHFNSYKALQPGQAKREDARERQLIAQLRREQLQKALENSSMGNISFDAIVNVDKTGEQDYIRVNQHIARRMKPHQLEGVQFMWTEIVASTANEGCLLAQPMGMGKTMQVIAFMLTIAEAAKNTLAAVREQIPERLRPAYGMILAPPSLVENWYDELLKWLPSNSSTTIGEIHKLTNAVPVPDRISIVKEWDQQGGVLLLATSLFRQVILEDPPEGQMSMYGEIAGILRTRASIVVVDEAQELKNAASKLSLAVRQVETRARIAMTGSPLANNLGEYFNLIDFVAEGYLGTIQDFRSRYITPITEGQYVDASRSTQRRALKMQKVLTQDLSPKIHRADIAQLHQQLHGKTEFVIRVHLTDLQLKCYEMYIASIQRQESDSIQMSRLWAFLSILKLLCNHPKCFRDKLLSQGAKTATNSLSINQLDAHGRYASTFDVTDKESEALAQDPTTLLENDMLRRQLHVLNQPQSLDSPSLSNKMVVLFQIVGLCLQSHEKLLIFSHSIASMDFIESQLRVNQVRLIRIDGSTKTELRQEQTKKFNEGDDQVALVSTRAGGVGLNLFGASRVIILDDWFNPILEQQAIGRAYRIGQGKHVFVYRLVAAGSFEEELQNQALFKVGLANRIVDKKDTIRAASRNAHTWLRPPREADSEDLSEVSNRDARVLEHILRDEAVAKCFHSIKLGDSFLIEENEELTPEEQQDAVRLIEEEQLRRTNPGAYERMRASQQAALLRESANAMMRPPPTDPAQANGTALSLDGAGPTTWGPSIRSAPTAQMSPAHPQLTQIFNEKLPVGSDASAHLDSMGASSFGIGAGGPRTPERPTGPQFIDLTLSETWSRGSESHFSDPVGERSPTSHSYDPPDVIDALDVRLKQEPWQGDRATFSPKKNRQLILPDSTKARPVGTYGIDMAAMPEATQPLATPDPPTSNKVVPADILDDVSRSRARNTLGDQLFVRLNRKKLRPEKEQLIRAQKRREAAAIEKDIFERVGTEEEYCRQMELAAQHWITRPRVSSDGRGKPQYKSPASPPSMGSRTQQHPTGQGKKQSTVLGTHLSASKGKPPPSGPKRMPSMGSGQMHSSGPGKLRPTVPGKQAPTNQGKPKSVVLEKHLSMDRMNQQSPSPNAHRQSHTSANGRRPEIRIQHLNELKRACTYAYQQLHKVGRIARVPDDSIIMQLAQKIEEEAHHEPSDAAYKKYLHAPEQRGLLLHLADNAPHCM